MRRLHGGLGHGDRAPIAVLVGGVVALVGAVLTWMEVPPAPGRAFVIDDAGLRIMLGLAVTLVVLGAAMTRSTDRRRWWPWALGLAGLGFVGVLLNWVILLIGVDAFRVTASDPVPLADRLVLGLPVYLLGCLITAVGAARVRSGIRSPAS